MAQEGTKHHSIDFCDRGGVAGGKFYLAFVKFLRPRWLKRLARSDVGSTDGVLAISSGRDNEEPPLGTDLLSSGSVARDKSSRAKGERY